jgi:ELWxxDGT repeat protein
MATVASIAALAVLAVATPVGAAGPPTLLKDINPTGSSNPYGLTLVGNTLFFAADDGVHGVELWKSDGTAAGTKMVKNIRPYGKSSSPEDLTAVGNTLFFTANDGKHGRELWKSDGTKAGTVMVKDIATGPKEPFGLNSISIQIAIPVGSRLFFFEDVCCVGTSDLYVSDGTPAGTFRVNDEDTMITLPDEGIAGAASGKFYFVTRGSDGEEFYSQLWVSDGTVAGTRPVPRAPTPDGLTILPAAGRYLYFAESVELGLPPAPTFFVWRTDGTAAGTKPLTDTGELTAIPTEAVYMTKRLYFNGGALWKSDGTANGTQPISNGALTWLTSTGDRLFFTRGLHLWKSDGTAGGTKDIGVFGTTWPRQLVAVGDELCFAEFDWDSGTWALWESDGTKAGTYLVRSFIYPYESTTDDPIGVAVGSRLFFGADDGTHGVELWSHTP